MIESIREDLFRIEVPLPNSPLKTLNAYCIKGEDRHLLIDTGFNRPECRKILYEALRDLEVDRSRLDLCITHLHSDHSGLAADLMKDSSGVIRCSAGDGAAINNFARVNYRKYLDHRMLPHGFTPTQADELVATHQGVRFSPSPIDFEPARAGDVWTYGCYNLHVVSVPGHTPDHIALYEPERKLFFSGDHILGDISPNITRWPEAPDALGDYLHSLEAIAKLDIALTLPGHRSLIPDTSDRIRQLRSHHSRRLDELRHILAAGPANAYIIASRMRWRMRYASWEDFPVPQKWFATGEALAHLDRLVALGEVEETTQDGLSYFRMAE